MYKDFSARIIAWQQSRGRHDLPWQGRDAYHVWVSEIMLQQTQVATVIPYFERFMARFPDVATLAHADEDAVLAAWSGLGYYRRARLMHEAARRMVVCHAGRIPEDFDALVALPGIGRSTAGAIAALAFGARHAILDGNVKRVLARHAGIEGWPGEAAVAARLWTVAEQRLPSSNLQPYTQGLMDLGAMLCTRTRPACASCPVHDDCVALREGLYAALPAARPRKALPTRRITWLILRDAGRVLLEKRPPTGVWAGLWSLPETVGDGSRAMPATLGCQPLSIHPLPGMRHTFTHFHLDIEPVLIHVRPDRPGVAMPGRIWLDLDDLAGAALPSPVRRLLEGLPSSLHAAAGA